MIYRENGQFKSTYRADLQMLPILQDRVFMIALVAFAFLIVPLMASDYLFLSILIPFLIVFAIGFYFARRKRTSEAYFLASRDVGWFAIGASLFVSNISTEHFIGLAGSGATSGLAVGHFEWLACFMLLTLGWVFVPFYLRSNVFTMPEFLERRFDRSCSVYLAIVSILAYIFTKISVHLYAAAVVLERVVGWDPMTAAVMLVIATGVYTIAGGLAAVIYTDLVQTVILVIGAIVLTVIGLTEVGGFTGLRAALPADYFHMMKPVEPEKNEMLQYEYARSALKLGLQLEAKVE